MIEGSKEEVFKTVSGTKLPGLQVDSNLKLERNYTTSM